MRFTIPVRTYSESNLREHWSVRYKRSAAQRESSRWKTASSINQRGPLPPKPWRITLTRIGKRRLDTGNNPGSMKAVQDGICDALRIDDGDEAHDWIYKQRIGKEYAVEVEITAINEKEGV